MEQPNEQSIEPIQSPKNILITIIIIIFTALIVGGGVYAWQWSNLKNTEQKLQQQIFLLQNQINQLQQELNNQNALNINQDQGQGNDNNTPMQPLVDNEQTSNTKSYSSDKYDLSFSYPGAFYLLDDPSKWDAILISEAPIDFPDIGGTSAPVSITILNKQTLNDELNSLESKKESPIIIDGISARRIAGIDANIYDKNIKNKLFLVIVESKNLVIRGFESPMGRKINFDLESIFDQIVNSLEFD